MEAENTNWQPKKQIAIFVMMPTLILVSLFRGSGKEPSFIGSERCSPLDWSLLTILLSTGFAIIVVTFDMQLKELKLKQRVGFKFVKGDLKYTPKMLLGISTMTFCVGFANALAGVGPGVMLQVLMMKKLSMHPMVAERTGNLLAGIITTSAFICAYYYGELPLGYGAVFGLTASIGTAKGMGLRD